MIGQRKRRVRKPPDLTSLFDVMFIVVFVALIRAASAQQAAAAPKPPPPPPKKVEPPPLPADVAALRTKATNDLPTIVIRVSKTGTITSIEKDKLVALDIPLLEKDPALEFTYLGERSSELRLCRLAAVHLAMPDLAKHLVIVAVDAPLADLPHALIDGLHADLDRCMIDQRALATLVQR